MSFHHCHDGACPYMGEDHGCHDSSCRPRPIENGFEPVQQTVPARPRPMRRMPTVPTDEHGQEFGLLILVMFGFVALLELIRFIGWLFS